MTDLKQSINKSSGKRLLQFLLLVLILIVLPLGTLYYTSSGNEYFKELNSELHDYGSLPEFQFAAHNGQSLTKDKLKGKLVVNAFFSLADKNAAKIAEQLRKLHRNFDDHNEVLLLLHSLSPEEDQLADLQAFATKAGLVDEEQCYLLRGDQQLVRQYLSSTFKWPEDYTTRDKTKPLQLASLPPGLKSYPYFIIADDKSKIRNYYAFEDNQDMARMVEHLALLLPSRTDNDPELKREKEK